MSPNRWGFTGPPPEAYSRVTNPDRFSPLHSFVLDLLVRLEAEFNVTSVEGYGIDTELEARGVVRPTVKLAPSDAGAAPITVAFSAFPGLAVRFGRWKLEFFPGCGCDACDETAEGESDRIQEQVDSLVAGQFREAIVLPFFGTARSEWEFGSSGPRSSGGWAQIDRSRARSLIGGGPRAFDWSKWSRK